jgi:hypothetical protein
MRRLISKQEFDKNMEDYSQLCCTVPPLNNMGVSEQHVFETFKSPASAFHAAGTNYMDHLRQHDEHQVGNFPPALCSQFPTHHSNNILLCQSSQSNFSIDHSFEKAGSNFDFSDTLQSLVQSHCSSQCFSNSSEKPNKIPCNSMISKPFPHAHNTLLGDQNDALVKKQLSVPSDANHPGLNVIFYLPFLNLLFFFWIFTSSFPNYRFVTVHHPGQLHQIKNESDGLKIFMTSSSRLWISWVVLRVSNLISALLI